MRIESSLGTFTVEAVPGHPGALVVTGATRADLESLKRELLPDLVLDGRRAMVARDEWEHALTQLVDRI